MAVNDRELDHDDARIAALYREAAGEEPSAALDSAVLRNARASIAPPATRPRIAWWKPWRVPFAFAAVAVMSVSIALIVEREGGEPLTLETPAPPPPPPPAPGAAPPSPPPAPAPDTGQQSQATQRGTGAAAVATTGPSASERLGRERIDAPPRKQAEERARADRNEAADGALAQKQSQTRERELLRDAAPAEQAGAGPGSRAAEPAVGGVQPQAAASAAAPPRPAAAAPERAPAVEAKAAQAPPAGARPFVTPAPSPAAKAEIGSTPKSLPAERRAAKIDARDPVVAALIAELEQRPPIEWRERIVLLRREGRGDHADALAAEYRRRFPDEAPPPER